MIEFTKLVFRGFMSYRDRQEVPLSNQGIVRIEGRNLDEGDSNRSGKSAVIEPLVWSLFARTIRGIRNDSVVYRFKKKRGCYADTYFRRNNIPYRVCRYQRHPKYKNNLRFWVNGKEKSSRHKDRTQEKIESALGCDYNSFVNSVVFGGAKPFASLSDAEQKKVLESFLHFERIDNALQYTKSQVDTLEEHLSSKQKEKAELTGKASSFHDSLKSLRGSEKTWVQEAIAARRSAQARLDRLNARKPLKTPLKRLQTLENRLSRATSRVLETKARYSSLRGQISELEAKLQDRSRLLEKEACPTCGQDIKKSSLEAVVRHYEKELKKIREQSEMAHTSLLQFRKEEEETRSKLERVQRAKAKIESRMQTRMQMRRELMLTLNPAREEMTPFASDIQQTELQYSKTMSKLLQVRQEEQSLQRKLKDLKFWIQGFGNQGVKALVVRQALPAMNAKLQEYAEEIFDGKAELNFSPTRKSKQGDTKELFSLQYKARRGAETYLGESSGGRRRVDICCLLVFSWLSGICNLLLVDELLDSLDSQGKETVLRILEKLRGTVLVISHDKHLKSQIGSVWTVTKKHGCSTLEIDDGK
jgi:DNA repair exonuclease SbcCD ATPase subunit